MPIKGKLNIFEIEDIKRIDPDYDLNDWDAVSLYNMLEEYMLNKGFGLYEDEEMTWIGEEVYSGYHWLRWSCMVVKGIRRNKKLIINSVKIQYEYIK
jgi:hypothetical protein